MLLQGGHREFQVTYGCFLTLKKAISRIKIRGCRCWLEQPALSLESTSTAEFHLLTQIKDQVRMKPTYYQLYFSKSSHAEVKLKHTLETSPEFLNHLQTQMNSHTGNLLISPNTTAFLSQLQSSHGALAEIGISAVMPPG